MRIAPYYWQLTRWTLFLQVTLVALVLITKNSVGNVALDNTSNSDPEDEKELTQLEVHDKRQIVDPDDELNPKPSDFTKEDVNLQSEAFFYPVSNNDNDEAKSESSISKNDVLLEHLDRLKKPNYENVQVPLYDDDIENNPDPLRGILDPNYWEEGNPLKKVFNFFGKPLTSNKLDTKGKGDVDNNSKTKFVVGNDAVGKGNIDEKIQEEKDTCIPNHFINKLVKSDDKLQRDKKHWFQTNSNTKSQDGQREKLERNSEKSLTDKEAKVLPNDFTIVLGANKVKNDNENKDREYSQIPKNMANNLENVINKIVNNAVTGVLEKRVDDSKDIKIKDVIDGNKLVPVGNYLNLEEEIDDKDKFSSLSNIRRHLLSFNEEDEHSLDKPNSNGGNGYGRENYFAVDSNMDSMNRELKYKQNNLNFLKNTVRGVTKPSNNLFQEKLQIENVSGPVDNFNLSTNQNSKSNVPNSSVGFNVKKSRRRQVGTHTPSEAMMYIQPRSNLLDTDEKLKSKILLTDTIGIEDEANEDPRVESFNPLKHTKSANNIDQEKLSNENGIVGNINLSEMKNSNKNMFNPPVGFNFRKGRRRHVIAHTPSDEMVFIQPESNLANTDEKFKSKVLLKDITNGIESMATTNPDPMASSTSITSTSATASVSLVSSASVTAESRQQNVTDVIGNETTTKSMNDTNNATDIPVDDEDEQLNIDISNKVVDAIFAQANAHGSMRNTLGICRKSGDLKTIKGSKVVENKGESVVEDIMKCVNTMLKSHAEKQMCLMLDDDLHDFLKWLLLSGEPMHGKNFVPEKPERDKSEFLFPSMCSDTAPEQTKKPEVLQIKN